LTFGQTADKLRQTRLPLVAKNRIRRGFFQQNRGFRHAHRWKPPLGGAGWRVGEVLWT